MSESEESKIAKLEVKVDALVDLTRFLRGFLFANIVTVIAGCLFVNNKFNKIDHIGSDMLPIINQAIEEHEEENKDIVNRYLETERMTGYLQNKVDKLEEAQHKCIENYAIIKEKVASLEQVVFIEGIYKGKE